MFLSTISDGIYSFQLCLRFFDPRYCLSDICTCVHAKLLPSCPTLCNPMDSSPLCCSVHGIIQQEYWSGLQCPPPRDLLDPGIKPTSPTSPALASSTSLVAQMVKNLAAMWETQVWSIIWEDSLEKGMATHSSILAWRTP